MDREVSSYLLLISYVLVVYFSSHVTLSYLSLKDASDLFKAHKAKA